MWCSGAPYGGKGYRVVAVLHGHLGFSGLMQMEWLLYRVGHAPLLKYHPLVGEYFGPV